MLIQFKKNSQDTAMNQANISAFLEIFCNTECEMWVTELIFNAVLLLIIPTKCIQVFSP